MHSEPLRAATLLSVLAGVSDTSTGLLLIAAPSFVMTLLRLPVPAETVLLRFVGVFVFAVGASYALPFVRCDAPGRAARMTSVFESTGLVRFSVAAFLACAVGSGALDVGWLAVGAFDACVALAQFWLLGRGLADHAA